jgi:peptidoglycan/LPS O-acetylase OafA/YrhL
MPEPRGTSASAHLDAIRALCALEVFAGHVRQNLFVEWRRAFHQDLPTRLVYFITGFGHEAVMIFFVLSGYFVGGAVVRGRHAFSWPRYLTERLTRLWLVLLPALTLGAIFDGLTTAVGGHHAAVMAPRFTVTGWLGNLFFLQEVLVGTFGSNTPLWSLSYELWYYLAFPFLVLAATRRGRVGLLHLLAAAAILTFTGPQIAPRFALWLLGAAAAALPPLPRRGALLAVVAGGLGLGATLLTLGTRDAVRATFLADLLVSFFAALAVLGIRQDWRPAHPRYAAAARWLAGWSYSLYLVHFPPLFFLGAVLAAAGAGPWMPAPRSAAQALSIAVILLSYGYLVSRLTEAHTLAVRRLALRALTPSAAAPAGAAGDPVPGRPPPDRRRAGSA